MFRVLILSIFCLSCHTIKESTSHSPVVTEIDLKPHFQIDKIYSLTHVREFSFDSLMSYKSNFSLGPSHPALDGNPVSSYIEKKGLTIKVKGGESKKAIMHYTIADKKTNYTVYDSLTAILYELDSLQKEQKRTDRYKAIQEWNLMALDTLHFDILSNQSLQLDTIRGAKINKETDFQKWSAQRMNEYAHDQQLPEYWNKPLSFPHGPLKVGESFTYLDPENTLAEAPPLDVDYMKADTTDIGFDAVMRELCSADEHRFVKVDYHLNKVVDGEAHFDIKHYYHSYSPNAYDERIMGKGKLVYNIKNQYFSDYTLTTKSDSESNLLRHRMSKRSTNTIKWELELNEG